MSKLSHPHLHDEAAAYRFVERALWPDGPVCPRCGSLDRIGKLAGKSTRPGVYKCDACRKQFTRHGRHGFREEPHPAAPVAPGLLLLCSSQEGHSSPPAYIARSRSRNGGVVHVACASARRCGGALGPDGRRRRRGRDRRDDLRSRLDTSEGPRRPDSRSPTPPTRTSFCPWLSAAAASAAITLRAAPLAGHPYRDENVSTRSGGHDGQRPTLQVPPG